MRTFALWSAIASALRCHGQPVSKDISGDRSAGHLSWPRQRRRGLGSGRTAGGSGAEGDELGGVHAAPEPVLSPAEAGLP